MAAPLGLISLGYFKPRKLRSFIGLSSNHISQKDGPGRRNALSKYKITLYLLFLHLASSTSKNFYFFFINSTKLATTGKFFKRN